MIEREHIGIFGKMNSGKSSLMNLLTQQETSITDATPGTTADTKVALTELHGLGPVKLFDTAGLDEISGLGEKKRAKVLSVLKECDLILLVIDPDSSGFEIENMVLEQARSLDKQLLVVFNMFQNTNLNGLHHVPDLVPFLKFYPALQINALDKNHRKLLIDFILNNFESEKVETPLLPFLKPDEFYVLNIPMDDETPQGRFLRPQSMAMEYITRRWAYPLAYRMNLTLARSSGALLEKQRFDSFLNGLQRKPAAIITDSQAIDIMKDWVPDDIALTTFSVMMINYVSRGRIHEFVEGIKAMESLQPGDRILIAEACNHSRIQEDIGTVQIPKIIHERFPEIEVEFNFGREFQENEKLQNYKLIIHCGGCMISHQKLQARLRDLRNVNVPVSNYGVFLSWAQGNNVLNRIMQPWH